ncbi:hypothetical protein BO82DRAFT_358695 [Aspergillus uvarum CBS 121591]|uniref:Uncharacterized protein n=1 Tax=Aspergillus uvarum CBS 121591 TaxID=1448315 RepID=A0A319BW73_9EURO|nr:hypothetical protein BO82DRAFT_358695 [Aspergillus uvarum CBS 121591]PYH76945.1 hypothetical protein BO82DRAFT_358695 [Aspergillus uvarum CBS 121591]
MPATLLMRLPCPLSLIQLRILEGLLWPCGEGDLFHVVSLFKDTLGYVCKNGIAMIGKQQATTRSSDVHIIPVFK